jgi:predicted TIM-barrel fold metal-dependent hydrolase
MIIDCHGHYTTVPAAMRVFRALKISNMGRAKKSAVSISDRVCTLYPDRFVGVCALPQSPGVEPKACVEEIERCVKELGSVGCNLNPDPSGGGWSDPPRSDEWWYPVYEKLVELDASVMMHAPATCNPAFHTTGAHYLRRSPEDPRGERAPGISPPGTASRAPARTR